MLFAHNAATNSAAASQQEQRALLRQLRHDIILRYRPHLQEGPGPIRMMARIVDELMKECQQRQIDPEIMQAEIVNRTIGDINLRLVIECEGEPGGPGDYRMLADELGIALPNEQLHGYTAKGETYFWLRNQMMECERLLLDYNFDPRIYDIYGTGNMLLREGLAQEMQRWGLPVRKEQIFASIGAMDGIDKVLRGLYQFYQKEGLVGSAEAQPDNQIQQRQIGILFPEPGFGVPEWQARSHGYRLHHFPTLPEYNFKLTAAQLDDILHEAPDIRVIYLTITNNPTTFAYSPQELEDIHTLLRLYREKGHDVIIVADLAYIGTGKPEEDSARMAAFATPDTLRHIIFVSSFSKTYSLTGERFGWVTSGDPKFAEVIAPAWTNSMASLPGEWQLRFMAYMRLFEERPWLSEKLRAFYRLRRSRLIKQLQRMNTEHHLLAEIYLDDDATVYNWSRLNPGEDAFSLFEKTGIAGVPGSGFGYTDEYIRFSVGVIPVPEV